jgi:hypothetical protein
MYYFNAVEKAKVLQGRTVRYLAREKLFITEQYLCQILKGKKGCSKLLALNIAQCICWNAKLEDYFTKKEK